MTIELSHIGEPLVARMLASLASRGRLAEVRCAVFGDSLESDLDTGPPEFIADRALLKVRAAGQEYACNGAQAVDVLAVAGGTATAVELKLGLTRMSRSAFRGRFCHPCGISGHADSRLTGSMVAVLDRLLPFAGGRVSAVDGHRTWDLSERWWLVIRQQIWRSWRNQLPVNAARILVFDRLASLYGDAAEFDQLVRDIVGGDFAARWQIAFDE